MKRKAEWKTRTTSTEVEVDLPKYQPKFEKFDFACPNQDPIARFNHNG